MALVDLLKQPCLLSRRGQVEAHSQQLRLEFLLAHGGMLRVRPIFGAGRVAANIFALHDTTER